MLDLLTGRYVTRIATVKQLNIKVILEMEKLDDEFSTTYAAAQQYIHAQKEQSSETSEILSGILL